ncbi:hypothetical protein JDS87_08570 [Bacillus cereus]|uniref:hypothetical protein n=1 Tax=Bacillus cereus TaxID=1396 RepID=UPI0018F65F94|nr:hypothetical protein [Bacillus cereus]MBJ8052074.1 hypothetical protein [Bacillus cereus]
MNWFTSYVIMPLEVFNSRSIESAKYECMDVYKMFDTMSIDKFEELVEDSIVIIVFGNNPQHTEVTVFQNKVLKWQRENGKR